MSESEPPKIERRTVFVMAGLILAAVVSISFFQLDRHPAFFSPSEKFVDEIDRRESTVVFAHDPVALAALEEHRSSLDATLVPLTNWPPEGTVFAFGSPPSEFEHADLQRVAAESVWSVWVPKNPDRTPPFATATVETRRPGRETEECPRVAGGRHQCGDHGWTRMGPRQITVDGEESRCIWAHPMDGTTLRFRYPEVDPVTDDGRHLVLETGLRDAAVGTDVPVELDIRLGDRTRSHTHRDRRGWQSVRIPAVDEPAELLIDVSTPDSGRRHLCFRFDWR